MVTDLWLNYPLVDTASETLPESARVGYELCMEATVAPTSTSCHMKTRVTTVTPSACPKDLKLPRGIHWLSEHSVREWMAEIGREYEVRKHVRTGGAVEQIILSYGDDDWPTECLAHHTDRKTS